MAILRVKNAAGEWEDIPAIVGPPGLDGYSPRIELYPTMDEDGRTGTVVTVSDVNGDKSFTVWNGSGESGGGGSGVSVTSAVIREDGHLYLLMSNGIEIDCGIAKGEDGADGISPTFSSVYYPKTEGYTRGRTIFTVTDANGTRDFTIYDGSDGAEGTVLTGFKRTSGDGSPGSTDVYTMYFEEDGDEWSERFTVYNGKDGANGDKGDPGVSISSIKRTSGNGSPGTTDTYTISMTDGSSYTFQVYNGANGEGSEATLATATKPGLVMVDGTAGIGVNTENGNLFIKEASTSEIDGKEHSYKPITPNNLDYAVKAALVDNSTELSETEKESISEWLGIIPAICVQKESGDVTDLLGSESCRYIFGDSVTGMPIDGEWWFVDVLSNGYTDLRLTAISVSSNPKKYIRVCANNEWGDWVELATANNITDIVSLGANPTGGVDNDTIDTWKELGYGVAWISESDQLVSQPTQYGFIINYVTGTDVFQIFCDQTDGAIYIRSGDDFSSWFSNWTKIVTADGDGTIRTNALDASWHVFVGDDEQAIGIYKNGLGSNNENFWIDHSGEALFTDVYVGSKDNYKKLATVDEVGEGLSETAKSLLLTLLRNAAYTADVSGVLAALEAEFNGGGGGETDVTLVSISAVYSGGDVPVGTALTALTGIVVTAQYSDGSTAVVSGYTLSGEIASGSNTITVHYGGKTTTFTVTGVSAATEEKLDWWWLNTMNNTTFEYTKHDKSGGSAAEVYATNVSIGPVLSDGNTELRFTLDTSKVSKYKFRMWLYNSDGTPYKAAHTLGAYDTTQYSGDLTNLIPLRDPGAAGRVYVNGDWSYKIPEGCSAIVQVEFPDALTNSTIVDTSLLDANGKIYGVIDAITFRGEALNAYVVKEG